MQGSRSIYLKVTPPTPPQYVSTCVVLSQKKSQVQSIAFPYLLMNKHIYASECTRYELRRMWRIVCICMNIHIYIYMYIYIYAFIYLYIIINNNENQCLYVHVYLYVCMYILTYVYV